MNQTELAKARDEYGDLLPNALYTNTSGDAYCVECVTTHKHIHASITHVKLMHNPDDFAHCSECPNVIMGRASYKRATKPSVKQTRQYSVIEVD